MNNVVSGTWNLEIPGWDSLHGKKDENGRPQGGHIYQVRPLACSVPSKDFQHCRLPKNFERGHLGAKEGPNQRGLPTRRELRGQAGVVFHLRGRNQFNSVPQEAEGKARLAHHEEESP